MLERCLLQRISRAESRCPCPLKIEPAQVSGHVYYLADKVQARNFAALHGLGGKLVGVHAAGGDLRFVVAFRAFGENLPMVDAALEFGEAMIGPCRGRMQIKPAV